MSLSDKGNNVEEETDEVTVVTASPAQPVPSLDDLDLIDSSIQDVFTTGIEMTTESMMSTTMMVSDTESTEAVTDTSLSTLELLQDFDFLGGDNGFIHIAFVTSEATVKDATETYESMHEKESASTTMDASVETTTDSVGGNSEASLEEVRTTESYDD